MDVEYRQVESPRRLWVRSSDGVAHSVRESDGDHHGALCRKYVRGKSFSCHLSYLGDVCQACLDRLDRPVIEGKTEAAPQAVARGRGVRTLNDTRRGRNMGGPA